MGSFIRAGFVDGISFGASFYHKVFGRGIGSVQSIGCPSPGFWFFDWYPGELFILFFYIYVDFVYVNTVLPLCVRGCMHDTVN